MLRLIQFSSFLAIVLWFVIIGVRSNTNSYIEELKKNKSVEVVPVPNSTEAQVLAEALYFEKSDDYPQIEPILGLKRTIEDICVLSKEAATALCFKLQRLYGNLTSGKYNLVAEGNAEECKPYVAVFFHTSSFATRSRIQARKCPYQPNELFIVSRRNHTPLFVFTWVNSEKNYLHIDNFF